MKRILTTLNEKWPEYLLEIFVLIIGIYGAFALDEWREEQLERKAELRALIDLRAEYKANAEILAVDREYKLNGIEFTKTRINAIRNKNPFPLITKERLYWHGAYSYNGSSAVLNSLLTSGQISVIQNDSLKYLLSAWPEIVNDFKEDENLHIDFIVNVFTKYQRDHLTIGELPPDEASKDQWLSERPFLKNRYAKAMDDPVLMNLLQNNLVYIEIVMPELEKVEQTMNVIQGLIDKEIDSKK